MHEWIEWKGDEMKSYPQYSQAYTYDMENGKIDYEW